ncbi:MAG TPA: hypothetical protein VK465_14520 [Fibrobacteria bacterium]|nr:hypothetical protein [Fibrobacteria bacterium]
MPVPVVQAWPMRVRMPDGTMAVEMGMRHVRVLMDMVVPIPEQEDDPEELQSCRGSMTPG